MAGSVVHLCTCTFDASHQWVILNKLHHKKAVSRWLVGDRLVVGR